ncbi:MAG TPA: DUF47 domain-containing protein [Rhizomicrobium sp.]|jgi:predicted phosphate transport protein (TIGR00153 family)|nr:DUF47 domain-containing protein [Rhizomicrobium sp.]
MLRWFQALMPHEGRFFILFNKQADVLVNGAQALREVMDGGPDVAAACERVMEYENQADAITHDVLQLVGRTLITPFDRSEIKDLIDALDDTIDQMQKTAKAVMLFEVETLEPEMVQMGEQIIAAAQLTAEAVGMLGKLRDNAARLNMLIGRIIQLEDDSDTLNEQGIKALFKRHKDGNAMGYIVGVEIYDHLEKVMDRFEDVAKRISGILIEQM